VKCGGDDDESCVECKDVLNNKVDCNLKLQGTVKVYKPGSRAETGMPREYTTLLLLSIPFMVLYGLGTPMLYGFILGHAALRRNLHDETLRTRYGWIYTKFNERSWWFFLVDMLRKLLTVLIVVLTNKTVLGDALVTRAAAVGLSTEQVAQKNIVELMTEGESIIQGCLNIILILINAALMVWIRPYRCLECKLTMMQIDHDRNDGGDEKLEMLDFEDALAAKAKKKSGRRGSVAATHVATARTRRGRRRKADVGLDVKSGFEDGDADGDRVEEDSGTQEENGSNAPVKQKSKSTTRWKRAGAVVKMKNVIFGGLEGNEMKRQKSLKWYEADEYASCQTRARRKCRRCCLATAKCQCLCHVMSGCQDTCFTEREELEEHEKCNHLSNTDQMEAGLLTIQLCMVSFGIAMMFIKRVSEGGMIWQPEDCADTGESLMDCKFTVADIMTVSLMLFLVYPLWMSIRITMKAMKAYGAENKETKKSIEGNTCCAKWMRRIGNG
jgi:hypothetical protein